MRHLSTPVRGGLNSVLLYNKLADFVVTTSSVAASAISQQARRSPTSCICIPTGVNPEELIVDPHAVDAFRKKLGLQQSDVLIGTACVVRSWKGIKDFLRAAALLKQEKRIKWVVIGGGYVDHYKPLARELGVEEAVTFTGHLEDPYAAIASLDIFALLSTAHEGISQASLQAAYLQKPLITTSIGGLPEVCIQGQTGVIVSPFAPEEVAKAILYLSDNKDLCLQFGRAGKRLVEEKFTFSYTLDRMEKIYQTLCQVG